MAKYRLATLIIIVIFSFAVFAYTDARGEQTGTDLASEITGEDGAPMILIPAGEFQMGSFNPNGYGLYDMAGNVWEWCADWYDKEYYGNSPGRNPSGPGSGETRVVRGSSWYNSDADSIRVSYRLNRDPTNSWIFLGFRCARDAR